MIGPGTGVRVYLACGTTDMRGGLAGLSMLAQDVLRQDPTGGAVFAFRGKRGDRLKLLYWDGQGFCLYYKVLQKGSIPEGFSMRAGVQHFLSAGHAARVDKPRKEEAAVSGFKLWGKSVSG